MRESKIAEWTVGVTVVITLWEFSYGRMIEVRHRGDEDGTLLDAVEAGQVANVLLEAAGKFEAAAGEEAGNGE